MKRYVGAALIAAALAMPGSASALTFDLAFDLDGFGMNAGNGVIDNALVGTGSLSFDGDPGDGAFLVSTLSGLSFSASFMNGDTFTLADLDEGFATATVVIDTDGATRTLAFDSIAAGDLSLGFVNATNVFEVLRIGANALTPTYDLSAALATVSGTAVGFSIIPLPATALLLPAALGFLAYGSRRRAA